MNLAQNTALAIPIFLVLLILGVFLTIKGWSSALSSLGQALLCRA